MANPEVNATAAQKRQEEIDKKTTFGQYFLKGLKSDGLLFGGMAIGGLSGWGLTKTRLNDWVGKLAGKIANRAYEGDVKAITTITNVSKISFLPLIGVMIGSVLGGLVTTYGHWKKLESEKLAVDEINRDIANLVQERGSFAETLTRQEGFIQNLITERKDKPLVSPKAAQSHTEPAHIG